MGDKSQQKVATVGGGCQLWSVGVSSRQWGTAVVVRGDRSGGWVTALVQGCPQPSVGDSSGGWVTEAAGRGVGDSRAEGVTAVVSGCRQPWMGDKSHWRMTAVLGGWQPWSAGAIAAMGTKPGQLSSPAAPPPFVLTLAGCPSFIQITWEE